MGRILQALAMVATMGAAAETLPAATPLSPASEASATVLVGTSYTATFAATGAPTGASSYTVSGLPPGLSVAGANFSAADNTYTSNGPFVTIAGTPTAAGNYPLIITAWELANNAGTSFSYGYSLTVNSAGNTAPVITTQPTGRTIPRGSSVTFSAAAIGSPAPTYQWQKGGIGIPGATSANLPLASVSTADTGNYTLVATNSLGSATSIAATLFIGITAANQVDDTIVTTGHGAVFSAGNTSGSIQWQISTDGGFTWSDLADNSTYHGTSSATLTVTNAGASLAGARYRFQATNAGEVATSNGAQLTVAPAIFPFPTGIATDGLGNVYVSDSNANTVQLISASGLVSLVAGNSGTAGSADGAGSAARFNQPAGITAGQGVLYVADSANATIRRIGLDGAVTTLAGSATIRGSLDGSGAAALFSQPLALAIDGSGTLYVADAMNDTVRKVTASGAVTTIAGTAGVTGSADGTGAAARFNLPTGIAVAAGGTIVVSDTINHTIRSISPTGVVTTLAGLAGVSGFTDGTGAGALFSHPGGLAADSAGNIYVADTNNSTIRKITPTGVVTTVAGLPGIAGLQDGKGTNAWFNQPQALALDAAGNLYVADTGNAAIRKITAAGVVATLALARASAPAPTPAPAHSADPGGKSHPHERQRRRASGWRVCRFDKHSVAGPGAQPGFFNFLRLACWA